MLMIHCIGVTLVPRKLCWAAGLLACGDKLVKLNFVRSPGRAWERGGEAAPFTPFPPNSIRADCAGVAFLAGGALLSISMDFPCLNGAIWRNCFLRCLRACRSFALGGVPAVSAG